MQLQNMQRWKYLQRRMVLVVNFPIFYIIYFCFVFAICDQVHKVEAIHHHLLHGLGKLLTASGNLF